MGALPDRGEAPEANARRDVDVRFDAAVVLDDRTGVDDDVVPDLSACVHDRVRQDMNAAAELRPGGDDRRDVDDRRKIESGGQEALEDAAAGRAVADAAHSREGVGNSVRAHRRERIGPTDRKPQQLLAPARRIVVHECGHLEAAGGTNGLENRFGVRASTEPYDRKGVHERIIGSARPSDAAATLAFQALRMTHPRSTRALAALTAPALGLAFAACSGAETPDAKPQPAPVQTTRQPPPAAQATVRIVDGDTLRPVRGAKVSGAGASDVTDAKGLGALAPRKRATVRVSARGYAVTEVPVKLQPSVAETVRVWQPALQWPMYGVNPARTQVHSGIKLRPPFRVVWRRYLGGLLEFPAIVWNGVAYVNNIHGYLTALSMKNGRALWRKRIGTLLASSPGLDPERGLLVTTTMSPGDVKVVSMKTGRVHWRYSTGRAEPSPLIRNGIAYLAAANGTVYALDLDRRRPRWIFHGGAKIAGSPTVVGNRLYIGDYAGRVFALSLRTGRLIWRGSAGSRVYGTIAASGGRLFVPSVFSGLSALSARTGRLLWRIPVGAYLYSSPATFRNRVYFGTYAARLYCADARTGRILWSRAAPGRVSGAVEIVAGVVYAATLEEHITAWQWRTGRRLWGFGHGQYVPVSGNGVRLLLHGTARIWAVEPRRRK